MTGVVVVTHGGAGAAMIAAAEQKVGRIEAIVAVGVAVDDAQATILQRVEEAALTLPVEDIVFLVDLGGSTPFNVCCKSCRGSSVVVSGVNLAMLFKLSTANRDAGARQLAEELIATGTKSIGLREGQP